MTLKVKDMARIKYKKKKRKASKLRGDKYMGHGQVNRHRNHPGGRGRAGAKDHLKMKLLKEGYEYGTRGFVHHGVERPWLVFNLGQLCEMIRENKIPLKFEEDTYVVDLTSYRYLKILGDGRIIVDKPIKLILRPSAKVSEKARQKIEAHGGEIVIAE